LNALSYIVNFVFLVVFFCSRDIYSTQNTVFSTQISDKFFSQNVYNGAEPPSLLLKGNRHMSLRSSGECGIDHLLPSCVEVTNTWCCTLHSHTPPWRAERIHQQV